MSAAADGGRLEPTSPIGRAGVPEGATLTELSREFVLYTHAVYLTHGRLAADPVCRFYEANLSGLRPSALWLADRPFRGLSESYDRCLYLVEREHWPALRSYLDSVVVLDPRDRFYARALRQRLPLLDPYAARKSLLVPPLPYVEVEAYGLDGNRFLAHFVPALAPGEPVRLRLDPPDPETVLAAEAVLGP